MARTKAALPAGSRITDYISLGVITKFVPLTKVREILEQTSRTSIRERDLPAHVVVYYVIALALYMRSSYRENRHLAPRTSCTRGASSAQSKHGQCGRGPTRSRSACRKNRSRASTEPRHRMRRMHFRRVRLDWSADR